MVFTSREKPMTCTRSCAANKAMNPLAASLDCLRRFFIDPLVSSVSDTDSGVSFGSTVSGS